VERADAIQKLNDLVGQSLHSLAQELQISVTGESGKVNKGWAGHTIERYLGLPRNSSQSPNFGSWELKVVPFRYSRNGTLRPKESMAVTMIDPYEVANTPFEESHLYRKLAKAVLVGRIVGSNVMEPSHVFEVRALDLVPGTELFEQVRQDYETVRSTINKDDAGFISLTGRMGVFIQPRTKGAGHGSFSRAFYARPSLLQRVFEL
jgi:DNA mismatch repair protein MutH